MNEVSAKIIELANDGDIQDSLAKLSGKSAAPNVFINGEHVGGNSDVQGAWSSSELQKKIE